LAIYSKKLDKKTSGVKSFTWKKLPGPHPSSNFCANREGERERAQKNRQTISLYKYTRKKGKGFLFS
jgi:hypothetical protein